MRDCAEQDHHIRFEPCIKEKALTDLKMHKQHKRTNKEQCVIAG